VFPITDSIVALSTPPGRSGIGVIRLSGPRALELGRILIRDAGWVPKPNQATLRNLRDPANDSVLDQALITYFKAPHSFTGEDIVEFSCHGSPVLLRKVIEILLSYDARTADPGEFTLRALAHGRMNLTQAEAVRDLINAQTDAAVRQATRQLRGELSHMVQPAQESLIEVIVRLESALEFVEDDLPDMQHDQLVQRVRDVADRLRQLAGTYRSGKLLRDGLSVTLVGRPNVGKSSVFNRLVEQERAIVTEIPGTTRDTLTEGVDIGGVPVFLTDTAGVRRSDDKIESMGVERTRRSAADADLVLLIVDGAEEVTDEDCVLITEIAERPHIVAMNKSDLPSFQPGRMNGSLAGLPNGSRVSVSAKSGAGLDQLRTAILKPFINGSANADQLVITNARHHDLLRRAAEEISASESLLEQHVSEELILVGLHNALRYLGDLLGETTTEDILGEIFSTFCIGK
jgi:tRNA modification GTPase